MEGKSISHVSLEGEGSFDGLHIITCDLRSKKLKYSMGVIYEAMIDHHSYIHNLSSSKISDILFPLNTFLFGHLHYLQHYSYLQYQIKWTLLTRYHGHIKHYLQYTILRLQTTINY